MPFIKSLVKLQMQSITGLKAVMVMQYEFFKVSTAEREYTGIVKFIGWPKVTLFNLILTILTYVVLMLAFC